MEEIYSNLKQIFVILIRYINIMLHQHILVILNKILHHQYFLHQQI